MDFEAVVNIVHEMIDKEHAFIALSPPYEATIEIDRSVIRDRIVKGNLGTEAEFERTAGEIGTLLLRVLDGDSEQYLDYRISQEFKGQENSDEAKKAKDELPKKFDIVKTEFCTEHLRKRYKLKKYSKAPSFTDIDWDIKVKHADAKIDSLEPFPYATRKIKYQTEFDGNPLAKMLGQGFGAVQINLSVDEIGYLIRVLTTLKKRLESVEKDL